MVFLPWFLRSAGWIESHSELLSANSLEMRAGWDFIDLGWTLYLGGERGRTCTIAKKGPWPISHTLSLTHPVCYSFLCSHSWKIIKDDKYGGVWSLSNMNNWVVRPKKLQWLNKLKLMLVGCDMWIVTARRWIVLWARLSRRFIAYWNCVLTITSRQCSNVTCIILKSVKIVERWWWWWSLDACRPKAIGQGPFSLSFCSSANLVCVE